MLPRSHPRPPEPLGDERYLIRFTADRELHAQIQELKIPDAPSGSGRGRGEGPRESRCRSAQTGARAEIRSVFGPANGAARADRGNRVGQTNRTSRIEPNTPPRLLLHDRFRPRFAARFRKETASAARSYRQTGRRCSSRDFLEFHHREPWARQQSHAIDGITLRCRAHNQYEAEREFRSKAHAALSQAGSRTDRSVALRNLNDVLAGRCVHSGDLRDVFGYRSVAREPEPLRRSSTRTGFKSSWRQIRLREGFRIALCSRSRPTHPRARPRIEGITMKLYATPVSRALRSIWAAEEVGVDYELISTSYREESKTPDYLAINPNGRIPALVAWRSRTLRVDGHQPLSRQDRRRQARTRAIRTIAARAIQWTIWSMTELEPQVIPMVLHKVLLARGPAGPRGCFQRRYRDRKTAGRARRVTSRIGNTCSAAILRLPT